MDFESFKTLVSIDKSLCQLVQGMKALTHAVEELSLVAEEVHEVRLALQTLVGRPAAQKERV